MENLGVNILETDAFCSDLFALFFDHLRDCSHCSTWIVSYLVAFFVFLILISFIFSTVTSLFSDSLESKKLKKKYSQLESDYNIFSSAYCTLLDQYNELSGKYLELEKEYLHTCN